MALALCDILLTITKVKIIVSFYKKERELKLKKLKLYKTIISIHWTV